MPRTKSTLSSSSYAAQKAVTESVTTMKKKVGRPQTRINGKRVGLYLDDDTRGILSKMAFDLDMPVSGVVGMLAREKAAMMAKEGIVQSEGPQK